MRKMAFLLSLSLISSPASAEEERDRVPELKRRIEELEKENAALRRKAAELQNQLVELVAKKATERHIVRHVMAFDGEREPAHLKGIELPEMPSKYQVREYVARILRAAVRNRGGYGADDPEVRLLQKIGPAHADVLLEPLLYVDRPNADIYLIEALKSLVGKQHKELVLKALPFVRDLVQVVLVRRWTKDAAPILLRVLADRGSWTFPNPGLPTEWIEAVAELARSESYDGLKAFFYYGSNRYHTWKAIRGLSGIELKAEVDRLWPWAKELDDKWVRLSVAAVAAHYGHLDALEDLFGYPGGWP